MLNFSSIRGANDKLKWPSKSQWKQFFRILTKKERIVFFILVVLVLGSSISFAADFYFKNTEIIPSKGGVFAEGVIGQPRFVNPIYASSNDVDRDLTELLFAGLMKYDEKGEIVPDIAKEMPKVEDNGNSYRVSLKDNAFWSDSTNSLHPQKLTAEDVIYTIKVIQDQNYKSPLRASWLGVEVELISDYELRFKLKNPYSAFLENLTLKILPKHIWQDVSPQNFPLAIYNLKPVGSGPYKLEGLEQDSSGWIKSLSLKANSRYHGDSPNISEIDFRFFEKEEDLINAAERKEIDGFSISNFQSYNEISAMVNNFFQDYHFSWPDYFTVFFNPEKSKALSDIKVRQALNYGTDKREIIEKALDSQAVIIDSPILPEIYGFEKPVIIYQFDLEKAKSLLDEAGFKETENGVREKVIAKEPAFQFKSDLQTGSQGTEVQELQKCLAKDPSIYPEGEITGYFGQKTKDAVLKFQEKYKNEILAPSGLTQGTGSVGKSTRKKLNELCAQSLEEKIPLKISLTTVNQPTLINTAEILKNQWAKLGVEVEIKTFTGTSQETNDIIKPRNYEALLYGEVLKKIPDPFPFWHSIQKEDPGSNLAVYENKEADKLLEDARQALDEEKRKEKLEEFQDILVGDAPAVFLYSPDYIYFANKEIRGVSSGLITDPSKRFNGIANWYINTKRAWK